jgi:hypothetical protein
VKNKQFFLGVLGEDIKGIPHGRPDARLSVIPSPKPSKVDAEGLCPSCAQNYRKLSSCFGS